MKSYTVNIGGVAHVMQLSEEDAAARHDLIEVEPVAKAAKAPANKAMPAAAVKNK